jgi:hypothetical protein
VDRGDVRYKVRGGKNWLCWPDDKTPYLLGARLYTQGRQPDDPDRTRRVMESARGVGSEGGEGGDEIPGKMMGRVAAAEQQMRLKSALLMLEYRRKSGDLVEYAAVEAAWGQAGSALKSALMAIPPRLSQLLAAERDPHRIETLIAAEITQALTNLEVANVGKG